MLARVRIWCLAAAVLATTACHSSSPSAPSSACTLSPPAAPDWRLHTDGTLLEDSLNRVVFLRGVDGGGRSKWSPYMPFEYASESDFPAALASYVDRAATWGIDSMRVPWTWAALEPTKGTYDMGWLSRYEQLVDALWAKGIYSVVDFHQDVYSECLCGDGFPCWTIANPMPPMHDCPMWSLEYLENTGVEHAFDAFWAPGAVQTEYLAAWDQMIKVFADKPGVVGFEPINEPASGSASAGTFEETTLTDFYSMMIAHMSGLAPKVLVFVDTTGFNGTFVETNLNRPTGNFVFAPHFYPALNASIEYVPTGLQVWSNLGAKWNVPTWVGEFGTGHGKADALAYMTAHFAAFDALGLGGAEWEYSVETTLWNGETNSLVAADGGEYPVAKAVIRPYARAVAGRSISQSYDPASGAFTLTYTPATGITEVAAPARAYPSGMSVTVSAGCYDATSVPGKVLVDAQGATGPLTVTLTSPVALSDGG